MTLVTLQRHGPFPVRRSPAPVSVFRRWSSLVLGGLAFFAIVGGLVLLRAAIWMPVPWR